MKRVLVVDDDPLLTRLVRINLELSDFLVEEVWDGSTAMRILEDNPPDLLILDIMMPRVDGWDILKMIRESPELLELPVVILTARAQEEDALKGWEMGTDDYITKPFSSIRLCDGVKNVLDATYEERLVRRRRELFNLTGGEAGESPEETG
jgi:DNA-binding response OmpR family regulator